MYKVKWYCEFVKVVLSVFGSVAGRENSGFWKLSKDGCDWEVVTSEAAWERERFS